MSVTETIFALATPPGRGAIAVIRVSGPETTSVLAALGVASVKPRLATLRSLRHGGRVLDQALVLRFEAPKSYTGEDCVELHLHGGRAVVEGVIDALLSFGCRLAEPGEFTRRAFENGQMDLAQAEAVADLIDAETEAQAAQAIGQLGGALSRTYSEFRQALLKALALVEAEIDFPDEDVPDQLALSAAPVLEELARDLRKALSNADRGQRVREGYRIVLIGETNAGKSTLFNALVARDAAIVTPIAGTTRDVLDAELVLGGFAVTLSDTAGLRDSVDPVEAEGIRRARARAQDADLRIWVRAPGDDGASASEFVRPTDLAVLNKSDIGSVTCPGMATLATRAADGTGVTEVRAWIARRLADDLAGADFPAVTRERHRQRLTEALVSVEASLAALSHSPEMAADDLRRAGEALGRVTGAIGVEDVLGEVFSSFCIGK